MPDKHAVMRYHLVSLIVVLALLLPASPAQEVTIGRKSAQPVVPGLSSSFRVAAERNTVLPRMSSQLATALPSSNPQISPIFNVPTLYGSGGQNASSVAIADVNGDGKPDLLIANECDNNCPNGIIGVALGNGDGTFQPVVSYSSGGHASTSIAVGDVNGDGHPDLIVANGCAIGPGCSNGIVTVLLGNGDGTFQTAVGFNSGGTTPYAVALADVNGDGKLDVIAANTSGVGVLLGNGDGTFQTAVSYNSGDRSPDSVTVADVNGDGKPDVIVGNLYTGNGNYSRGSVDVLLGNGNGTFQAPVTMDSGGEYAYSVAAADVNGDGKTDLVVANNCADTTCAMGGVAVFLGNGDGTFRQPVSYASGGLNAESAIVRDVNGDGKPDLVVVNQCNAAGCKDGTVAVLLANGDGTFRAAISYDSGGHYGVSVTTSDVNGDGKQDLLITSACDNANACADGVVAVMLGNGDGTFQGAETFMPGGTWAYSVAIGDLNGDGKPDLVVADQLTAGGSLSVLLGNGNGTFQNALNFPSGGQYAYSVAIADVNGDGKPDLLVADYNAGVGVLLGNGDGTFQPVATYSSGGLYAYSIAVADMNGDGKPDLLVANGCIVPTNCPNGGVGVLLGNGDGTFRPAATYSSGGQTANWVAVADVNGDGKLDLVLANENAGIENDSNGSIGVLLGNGDGTFQNAVSYNSGGYQAEAVVVGDVNGDGKPDILVSNASVTGGAGENGIVGVLLGNGDGSFQPVQTVVTPAMGLGALVIADLNGDGKPDVASGIGDFVLLGNGDGTFQNPFQLGAAGSGVAVGDLNGDGRPDLAVGGVAVLLNVTPVTKTSTTTTLSSSQNPSAYGQSTTFTATIQASGTPIGTVTFLMEPLSLAPLMSWEVARESVSPH